MIIEVDAASSWGFGINWSLGGSAGNSSFGGSSVMGAIPNYQLPGGNVVSNKTMVVPLEPQNMYLGYLSNSSILNFLLLNATGTNSNINILSTPHILTIDNQEAEFNVGESIAVPSNSRMDINNNMYYTFEYQPVGLKLKLTPHITTGEKITLELYVEANSVLGSTTTSMNAIIPPNLAKRDIRTKVSIQDGSTIVVGGLMRSTTTEIENKVPLLGDIPLLGWFFKSKTKEDAKTNLLVFITPRVVTDPEKMKKITEEKHHEFNRNNEEKVKINLNKK
jgi:general secretion pathway protein D